MTDKLSAWAAGRAELIQLQRQAFEARQALDLECRREEHEKKLKLELDILELKKEEQIQQMTARKEKDAIEMEILKLRRDAILKNRRN